MSTTYYRYSELNSKFGIPFSRTHLKRLVNAGLFPAPVKLGPATVAWLDEDIHAYGEQIRTERDKELARRLAERDAGGGDARSAA